LSQYYELIEWVREHEENSKGKEYKKEDGQQEDEEDAQKEDKEETEYIDKCEVAAARYYEAKQNFEELSTNLGAFFLGSPKYPNALERILRYEAAIDRSLGRAQDQLARLQRDRHEIAAAQATVIYAKHEFEETSD